MISLKLDAARIFYPVEFLTEMCSYMFFKQNEFHIHLSDNLFKNYQTQSPDEAFRTLYAGFRLWSNDSQFQGIVALRNESYSREEFDMVQRQCARRGVTVIPEIEAPAHALSIKMEARVGS